MRGDAFTEFSDSGEQKSLLASISPLVYQKNAFRIAGLAVDSSARDIRRRDEELTALARLGGAPPIRPGALLPWHPPPGLDAVRESIEDLRIPVRRLVHELFWFWPAATGDQGHLLLGQGDHDGAAAAWHRVAADAEEVALERAVAQHNVTVLEHLQLLESEHPPGETWIRVLRLWRAIWKSDLCWQWLQDRVMDRNDPRLTANTVADLRAALPGALLAINATLAAKHWEAGESAGAERQLGYIRASGFPAEAIEQALAAIGGPLIETVRRDCRRVDEVLGADKSAAVRVATELLDRTARPLALVDSLYPAGHAARMGAHDEVGGTTLAITLSAHGEHMDDAAAQVLIGRAIEVAESEAMRTRLGENLTILKANLEALELQRIWGSCWFCGTSLTDLDSGRPVPMYGEVERRYYGGGTRVTWRSATLQVPRCPTCKNRQEAVQRRSGNYLLGVIAVGILLGVAVGFATHRIFFPILGALIFMILIYNLPPTPGIRRTKGAEKQDEARARAFPSVVERVEAGWHFGTKPAT